MVSEDPTGTPDDGSDEDDAVDPFDRYRFSKGKGSSVAPPIWPITPDQG